MESLLNNLRNLLGIFVFLLVTVVLFFIFRLGVFKPVHLAYVDKPALMAVAAEKMGPYHEILPKLQEVEAWIKSQGMTCDESFGEFLDNPSQVEHERLRAWVGCLVESPPTATLPEGFTLRQWPARSYLEARFEGSPALSAFKVYSKAFDDLREKRLEMSGPVLEIYRVKGDFEVETSTLFPVASKP